MFTDEETKLSRYNARTLTGDETTYICHYASHGFAYFSRNYWLADALANQQRQEYLIGRPAHVAIDTD